MTVLSFSVCDLQEDKCYFTICNPFIDNAIYFHAASFGPCILRFVFHRISAVVVASLSFAALSPHLVLRRKQRSYCSKIQSSFCFFLPCRTSMDSRKVHLAKLAEWLSCVVSTCCTVYLTVRSYHITFKFQSECTLYSCLNVKEPFARSRRYLKFKRLQRDSNPQPISS